MKPMAGLSFLTLALLAPGCAPETGSPRTEETPGAAGFAYRGEVAPEPTGPIRSPAGRWIEPGTIDEHGYILPLDVKRRRPEATPPGKAKPPRSDPSRARGVPLPFEEHRLGPDAGHSQNETTIDAEGDTLVAGWNNYTPTLVMGVSRSTDGGHTWADDLFSGHTQMSDPAVKSGRNGKWYYGYIAQGGSGGIDVDVYVRRSTDAGSTWSAPVAATSNGSFDDKPYLDARGDEVLVGWADFLFSPAKVFAVRSTDAGATFGPAIPLANASVGGNGACPVIDDDGDYFMFWRDSFQDSLWVSKSTNQGLTWTPDRGIVALNPLPSTLPGGFRIVNFPAADAHPATADLVVLWNDQLLGDPDILSIRSTDGGTTWSAPVRVNDDAGSTAQFFPWIDFDETGVAHAVWYDRRANGFDIDVYTSRSTDVGATWEANVRVTAAPFTPVLPWDVSVDFIGDYNGIAATTAAAFPFYQDARRGEQDVYVSILPAPATGVAAGVGGGWASSLRAAPNPFAESVVLTWSGDGTRPAVEIWSVDGRRVATLPGGIGPSVGWDGRSAGAVLPAGVYFARSAEREGVSVRIVKLR